MVEQLNIKIKYNMQRLKEFVERQGLVYDDDIDLALVIIENNKIVASACKKNDIFEMIAVDPEYHHMNYLGVLLTELINYCYEANIYHYFVFTKAIYKAHFKSFNFKLLASYEDIVLFEYGTPDFDHYFDNIKLNPDLLTGSIVMNLNPFTLGHLDLIQNALTKVEQLIIFVVEEDKSFFKFEDRLELVRDGVKELENVIVVPSGPYIISQATFPTYFLKELDDATLYYTNIDIQLYKKIMDKLNIKYRFVGEEPIDKLTAFYNQQLKLNLKDQLIVFPRKEHDHHVISASYVREKLNEHDFEAIKPVVTNHVYEFLKKRYDNND